MTVETTAISAGPFYPNGATTAFPFTFRAVSDDEVMVVNTVTGATISPTLYNVNRSSPTGGSVVFSTAPTASAIPSLTIFAAPSFLQQLKFSPQDAFLPQVHNDGLDRDAMRDLVLRDRTNRSILAPVGESGLALPGRNAAGGRNRLIYRDQAGVLTLVSPEGLLGAPANNVFFGGYDGLAGGDTYNGSIDNG